MSTNWINLSPSAGTGSDTVYVSASTNTGITRSLTLKITGTNASGNVLVRRVQIEQDAPVYAIFESDFITFNETGETKNVLVKSNTEWTITNIANWLTFSQITGSGNTIITVSASAMTVDEDNIERECIVNVNTVVSGGNGGDAVFIQQADVANNQIKYFADSKILATEEYYTPFSGGAQGYHLLSAATNSSISSHTFNDGVGIITFYDDLEYIVSPVISYYGKYNGLWRYLSGCTDFFYYDNVYPTAIVLPDNVTTISGIVVGGNASSYNTNLETYSSVFGYYHSPKEINYIKLPKNIKKIGFNAFGNSMLKKINLPSSLEEIGVFALSSKNNYLTNIRFPKNIKIGDRAFQGQSGITSIDIREDIEYADGALAIMGGLISVNISNLKNNTIPARFLYGNPTLTAVTINENIKHIGEAAFAFAGLKTIIIPSGVTEIDSSAFYDCTSLTSITLPSEITKIKYDTFKHCESLNNVVLPNRVTEIGNEAFSNCTGLKHITLSSELLKIGKYTFSNCTSLSSIAFPNTLEIIDEGAFSQCFALQTITFPRSIKQVKSYAFQYCYGITSFSFSDTTIEWGANLGALIYSATDPHLANVTIARGVTKIGASVFRSNLVSSITYTGTMSEWNDIDKDVDWNYSMTNLRTIHCTDGDISV